jgi:hypothetical protein
MSAGGSTSSYVNYANGPGPKGHILMMYNIGIGQLTLRNLSTENAGLPFRYVSAQDYIFASTNQLGYNQILVINNVFTGGRYNKETGVFNDKPNEDIPEGLYDILEYKNSKHPDFYRLDPVDDNRFNNMMDSNGRNGFLLHPGTISKGCVTIDKFNKDRSFEWNTLRLIMGWNPQVRVPDRQGRQGYNPFSYSDYYGTLKVIK